MKNKRILLTGGAGFIGTRLCDILSADNEMIIYDNLRRDSMKFTRLKELKNVTMVKGDVLDFDAIRQTMDQFKPNVIIHLAAIAGIDTVIKSPVETMEVNLIGTYNVLRALKGHYHSVERFIDFSTSEVFGSYAYKVDEGSTTNLAPVGEARWTYSVSKLAAEHLAHSYFKEFGLPVVSVRPFNVYGPGQVGEGAIHVFVKKAINNETINIHGDGDQIRSWCYIDDFVDGIMLCLENSNAVGNTFNIGNPQGTVTINTLADMIVDIAKSQSSIIHVPKNYVDVDLRIPSIDKARSILGFEPKVSLKQGISNTIDWYRNNEDNKK